MKQRNLASRGTKEENGNRRDDTILELQILGVTTIGAAAGGTDNPHELLFESDIHWHSGYNGTTWGGISLAPAELASWPSQYIR